MSKRSHGVMTATYLKLGVTTSVLVSCFKQVTQLSDAITVEIMRDIECVI
jgi:hypothetical protein